MEVWQWKTITAGTTQLANGTVYIKSIILWHTDTANAKFYNEKTAATTDMFLTIYCAANKSEVIMFDKPCQLDTGCSIVLSAGGLLVQFKPV